MLPRLVHQCSVLGVVVGHSGDQEVSDFYKYSLGGDTTAPSGLYARLCHAFLVCFFPGLALWNICHHHPFETTRAYVVHQGCRPSECTVYRLGRDVGCNFQFKKNNEIHYNFKIF